MAYTKLFNSIVTSSIWGENDTVRIVWITLLALSDKNGEVQASIPGLARVACVSIKDCEAAIQAFLSPDLYSRTKDDEGRRIEEIDGGWHLLNYDKYRQMASKEDAANKNAVRQARYRDKQKRNAPVTVSNGHVTQNDNEVTQSDAQCNAPVTHDRDIAEAEADTEEKKEEKIAADAAVAETATLPPGIASPPAEEAADAAKAVGKGKADAVREVFEHWRTVFGKRATTALTDDRRRRIAARLKEGFTVEELRRVAEIVRADPWYMGENDRNTVYDSIEVCYKNAEKVDRFLSNDKPAKPGTVVGVVCDRCDEDGMIELENPGGPNIVQRCDHVPGGPKTVARKEFHKMNAAEREEYEASLRDSWKGVNPMEALKMPAKESFL